MNALELTRLMQKFIFEQLTGGLHTLYDTVCALTGILQKLVI